MGGRRANTQSCNRAAEDVTKREQAGRMVVWHQFGKEGEEDLINDKSILFREFDPVQDKKNRHWIVSERQCRCRILMIAKSVKWEISWWRTKD